MKLFIILMLLSSISFAESKKAKPETKDKLSRALKEIDEQIQTDNYPLSPKDEAMLKMIEELEDRVAALEKK